jgi:hypothetical protein
MARSLSAKYANHDATAVHFWNSGMTRHPGVLQPNLYENMRYDSMIAAWALSSAGKAPILQVVYWWLKQRQSL